jgi:hypothetical protein
MEFTKILHWATKCEYSSFDRTDTVVILLCKVDMMFINIFITFILSVFYILSLTGLARDTK